MIYLILENNKINRVVADKKEDLLKEGRKIYDDIPLYQYEVLLVENNEIVKGVDYRGIYFYDEILKEQKEITEINISPGENWVELKKSLNYLKDQKIIDLNKQCNTEILSGFKSSALGSEHKYSSDEEAQRNLLGAARRAEKDRSVPYVCSDSEGVKEMIIHTPEQMLLVIDDGDNFKIECITKFHTLRKQIEDPKCDTEEKISAIVW